MIVRLGNILGNSKPIINNYNYNDIDYDKLAKAMVNAQEQAESKKKSKFTMILFAVPAAILLFILSFVFILLTIAAVISLFKLFYTEIWESAILFNKISICFIYIFLIIIMILMSIISFFSGIEIMREKDRNYIVTLFSGIVSFAALIVALVALYKGVA